MKTRWILTGSTLAVLLMALATGLSLAQGPGPQGGGDYAGPPIGTAFTYQGLLKKNGVPVNGTCDFWFTLYDAATGGNAIGYDSMTLSVTNGLFTAELDFDPVFQGARWLEIAVQCPGDTGYISLSPRQRLTPAPYALALPGLWTRENITSTNLIGGYGGNSVTPGVVGGTIGGGGARNAPNQVTSDYGTVGGGYNNRAGYSTSSLAAIVTGGALPPGFAATVGGGLDNIARGAAATVSGGGGNIASDDYATVGGGAGNIANGYVATVGGGMGNTASGYAATIPGGRGASASHYGEMAYASGYFGTPGDAQTSVYVLRNASSGTTTTELFLDGDGSSARLNIAPGRTVVFDILIVGRSNTGESAGYRAWGVIENVNNITKMYGAYLDILYEDDTSWATAVEANDMYDALCILVQGGVGDTIRWVALVRTVEVSW